MPFTGRAPTPCAVQQNRARIANPISVYARVAKTSRVAFAATAGLGFSGSDRLADTLPRHNEMRHYCMTHVERLIAP
jgi:hypothetical protein